MKSSCSSSVQKPSWAFCQNQMFQSSGAPSFLLLNATWDSIFFGNYWDLVPQRKVVLVWPNRVWDGVWAPASESTIVAFVVLSSAGRLSSVFLASAGFIVAELLSLLLFWCFQKCWCQIAFHKDSFPNSKCPFSGRSRFCFYYFWGGVQRSSYVKWVPEFIELLALLYLFWTTRSSPV